jgi:multidrug efflux pump subunit AcrA (membrane-fusion protein)
LRSRTLALRERRFVAEASRRAALERAVHFGPPCALRELPKVPKPMDAIFSRNSVAASALVFLIAACHAEGGTANAPGPNAAPPPPKVLFTRVVRKDVPIYLEAVATVDGYVNADIRARVRGYLSAQEYKEGGFVKANQRLFTIERAEYETAVRSAQATVARAQAVAERNNVFKRSPNATTYY